MKWLALVLLLTFPLLSTGAERCSPPEKFSSFLERYEIDSAFQIRRISNIIRFARAVNAGGTNERVERINISGKALFDRYGTFPQAQYRIREGLELREPSVTETSAVVEVRAANSDSYHRTYRFRLISGCWFLRGFDDMSL